MKFKRSSYSTHCLCSSDLESSCHLTFVTNLCLKTLHHGNQTLTTTQTLLLCLGQKSCLQSQASYPHELGLLSFPRQTLPFSRNPQQSHFWNYRRGPRCCYLISPVERSFELCSWFLATAVSAMDELRLVLQRVNISLNWSLAERDNLQEKFQFNLTKLIDCRHDDKSVTVPI